MIAVVASLRELCSDRHGGPLTGGAADRQEWERRTKTEAKNNLKEIIRDFDDGLPTAPHAHTVAHAVQDWLDHGLSGRDPTTVQTRRILANRHVIPALGARSSGSCPPRTSTAG